MPRAGVKEPHQQDPDRSRADGPFGMLCSAAAPRAAAEQGFVLSVLDTWFGDC